MATLNSLSLRHERESSGLTRATAADTDGEAPEGRSHRRQALSRQTERRSARPTALGRLRLNSLCILLQELYLTRRLDGNSLGCSNSLNRYRSTIALSD